MNKDHNMASAVKSGETNGSCDQVVRKFFDEVEVIKFSLEVECGITEATFCDGWKKSGEELKIFLMREFKGCKTWQEVADGLRQRVEVLEREEREESRRNEISEQVELLFKKRLEEEERKKKEYEEMRSRLMEDLRRERARMARPRTVECYMCGGRGHMARFCLSRQRKEDSNKRTSSLGDVVTVRATVRARDSEMDVPGSKRMRASRSLDELAAKYPQAMKGEGKKAVFYRGEKSRIRTARGVKIVKKGQVVPQSLRARTKELLQGLLQRGVIRRSSSDWRNPMRAILKPDGSVRIVLNLIALNEHVEKDPYELPSIKDVVRATQGSEWFTVIDLKEGFYNIEIEECDKHKTAFEFDGQVYEWNSMVMGFKNAPQVMQRVMNRVLDGLRGRGVEVYMDDIVVHGRTLQEHDERLEQVLKRFEANCMQINPGKIQYRQREAKLLGVMVNGRDQKPLEIKRNEALAYEKPRDRRELRRFLGLTGWFRDFIKDYAMLTESLTGSLRKNREWKWTEEMESEFNALKEALRKARELKLPDYKREFRLRTDACNTGISAVLLQEDREGRWVPIQWASKKLTPTERRYGITEKEMYAVFWGIKKFSYELRGRRFHLMTDHKALEEIRRKPFFENNRINRWIERIQEYDFTVEYVKGEHMVDADALSRQYEQAGKAEMDCRKRLRGEKVKTGKWNRHVEEKDGKEFWRFDTGKMVEIPRIEGRKSLVEETHLSLEHRGREAVYYAMRDRWYWPGMKETIRNVIKRCDTCQLNNRKKRGGSEFVTTSRKLEKVGLDVMRLSEEDKYGLVMIDYFTRRMWVEVLNTKRTKEVLEALDRQVWSGGDSYLVKSDREH